METASNIDKNETDNGYSDDSEEETHPTEENMMKFMKNLENYETSVPKSITMNLLRQSGMEVTDPKIVALVSVAAQKFISDIAFDALTHCKMRQANSLRKGIKDKKYSMNTEDLSVALKEKGIALKKPMYF